MLNRITDSLTHPDMIALAFFIVAWAAYTFIADRSPLRSRSISAAMDRQRKAWIREAMRRDLRMLDTGILQILVGGISIFASTTIFVIGGLVAGLGYGEEISGAISALPLAIEMSAEQWSIKLTLLLSIFVYAFFKFAWSIRLAHYCSILVGALPLPEEAAEPSAIARAEAAARISSLCGHHFNRGLRAYFFALAAVGWIFDPTLFMVSTVLVVLILVRREFSSAALTAVKGL